MRKFPAIVAAAGLLVSLSACATGPSLTDCAPSGNALLVTAPGAFGADPETTFPTPLVATEFEVATAVPGDGAAIASTDTLELAISLYNGDTGEAISNGTSDIIASVFPFWVNGSLPYTQALTCATVGSRFVVTGTAEQILGAESGLEPTATLVVVNDILDAYPAQATGADQIVPGGFPAVVFAPTGQPGFTFPDSVPSELSVAAVKQGSGRVVKEGDTIVANLTGIVWGGSATFASSFSNQAPVRLDVTALSADGSGIVEGLATAIIGQKVGSRLLVVVPPSVGYPEGAAPTGVAAGDTLVFVVDLLAIR